MLKVNVAMSLALLLAGGGRQRAASQISAVHGIRNGAHEVR